MSAPNSPPAHEFHGRRLPAPAAAAGYGWLIDRYGLAVPLPARMAGIATVNRRVDSPDWLLLPPRYAPEPTLAGQLTFALKWEGVDLGVLNALASAVPTGELAATVRQTPHGRYMRRLWFLFEWLTGSTLDVHDIGYGTIFRERRHSVRSCD